MPAESTEWSEIDGFDVAPPDTFYGSEPDSEQGLAVIAAQIGVTLTTFQVEQLDQLVSLLGEWNARFNLTAIRDPREMRLKHIVDSLVPCGHNWAATTGRPPASILDVGTGAGFPALPLAIAQPDIAVTALESSRKKAEFVSLASAQLGLNTRVVRGRAETEGQRPVLRERFDLVLARSVAYLPALAEYCLPFTRVGGHFIAMKSERVDEEIAAGLAAVEAMGGLLREPIPYTLPGVPGTRQLLIVEKVAHTPPQYPREPGVPKRKPIL